MKSPRRVKTPSRTEEIVERIQETVTHSADGTVTERVEEVRRVEETRHKPHKLNYYSQLYVIPAVDAVEAGKGQLEISVNQGRVPNNVQMQGAGRYFSISFNPRIMMYFKKSEQLLYK